MRRRTLMLGAGGWGLGLAATAQDLDAASRRTVNQLVLDRAAVIAAEGRVADARLADLLQGLSHRDQVLRRLAARRGAEGRKLAALEAEMAQVLVQGLQLIAELSGREPQFAGEIEAFRRQMEALAASQDPRRRDALRRYAAGDRRVALDILVDLETARTAAIDAGWIRLGGVVVASYRDGALPRGQAILLLERAAQAVEHDAGLWRSLQTLLLEAGRAADATAAGAKARAAAAR